MLCVLFASSVALSPTAGSSHALGRRAFVSGTVVASFQSSIGAAHAEACVGRCESDFKSVATQTGGDDFFSLGSDGLKYKDVRTGTGQAAAVGDTVSIQFSGRCLNLNGKKFISTQDAAALSTGLAVSEPFTFKIGADGVIPGLSQAVVGMAKDGYRRVVVPQVLGYDSAMTLQPIPDSAGERQALASVVKNPNRDASLLFDVKLERIKR